MQRGGDASYLSLMRAESRSRVSVSCRCVFDSYLGWADQRTVRGLTDGVQSLCRQLVSNRLFGSWWCGSRSARPVCLRVQGPVIKEKYDLCHLATGDMLRAAVAAGELAHATGGPRAHSKDAAA